MSRIAVFVLLWSIFDASLFGLASANADTLGRFLCEGNNLLERPEIIGNESSARWIHIRNKDSLSGSHRLYRAGHRIRLGDIALWIDPKIAEKAVWVYRGMANTVSQDQLLIFNEKTERVFIIYFETGKSDGFQCSPDPDFPVK
jgi:hypothetical protein